MHVHDHHLPARSGGGPDGAEIHITGADELLAGIGVAQDGLGILAIDLHPPDQAADRLGDEKFAAHFLRQAVAPENRLPGDSRENVKPAVRADLADAALHIGNLGDGIHFPEPGFLLPRELEASVNRRLLEAIRRNLAPRTGVIEAAPVVL